MHSTNAVEITVIGSGDAFSSGGRNHTCFYVKAPSCNFLIDLGATAFNELKKQGVANKDVDVIFISHLHGDHYGGLPFFLLEASIVKRTKPLTIVGPSASRERIESLLNLLYPGSTVLNKIPVRFSTYQNFEETQLDQLSFLSVPVEHSKASLPHGVRIMVDNKVIAYSGDTEWTANLKILAEDADLFICECNFYSSILRGHMSFKTLRKNLPNLRYKKLLLTHFGPEMIENISRINFDCAFDGMKFTI